jgi:hypothetical protein
VHCYYGDKTYDDGDVCCKDGRLFHCLDGTWLDLEETCQGDGDFDEEVDVPDGGGSFTKVLSRSSDGLRVSKGDVGSFAIENKQRQTVTVAIRYVAQPPVPDVQLSIEAGGKRLERTIGSHDYVFIVH